MYSRSYYQDEQIPIPPTNYDGTVFSSDEEADIAEESASTGASIQTQGSASSSPFSLGGLFNIFDKDKFSLSKIGSEELLIIAAAAFLFFSKGGDKECAIILLILLFIN